MSPTVYSPPVPTYTALATYTLTGSETSVTFASIPASYRDLVVVISGSITDYDYILLRYNGDTGSNYSYADFIGDGSGIYSNSATITGARVGRMSTTAGVISNLVAQIMDYSATDKHKTTLARGSSPDEMAIGVASRWANTNAITSVTALTLSGESFENGTTLTLYGIEA
jgi:hypothetical protein